MPLVKLLSTLGQMVILTWSEPKTWICLIIRLTTLSNINNKKISSKMQALTLCPHNLGRNKTHTASIHHSTPEAGKKTFESHYNFYSWLTKECTLSSVDYCDHLVIKNCYHKQQFKKKSKLIFMRLNVLSVKLAFERPGCIRQYKL